MTRRMTRRAFTRDLAALAGSLGLFCLPVNVYAQKPAVPRRIGFLLVISSPEGKEAQAFRQGLRDAGYVEGRDVVIEWRNANGVYDRIPDLVADLVQSKVDAIVVETTRAAQAARHDAPTTPIVMALVGDPVGSGLVASLAHPAGNVTGLSSMKSDLSAKLLQLLKDAIPRLTRVAVLWNPDTPWHAKVIEELESAARKLSIGLSLVNVRAPEQLEPAFSTMRRANAQALYLIESPLFSTHRATVLKLLSKARLPMIESERKFVDAGGLMSYGTNVEDLYLRSAVYIDKILKGAKPGDLPVEQPTRFELVVNLKTAKALGITIPQSILLQADEVIR
ncbi:MAG: ABC transporter substrate-binding protein [Betaproteobacteria bacterium]